MHSAFPQTVVDAPQAIYVPVQEYQAILAHIGLADADSVFEHPGIVVWRSIPERENCTLDGERLDGRPIRLHIKRYRPVRGRGWGRGAAAPAEAEAEGIFRLQMAGIPTVPFVAWGKLPGRGSFIITEDLAGYEPADKVIESGVPFDRVRDPVADLAADLHNAGLHHRDLYLCHFFVRMEPQRVEVRLIDAARVRPLPWLFGQRWIVKDVAQLWYSTQALPVTDSQRMDLLRHYALRRGIEAVDRFRQAVEKKAAKIARHDQRLRQRQPRRNISIPDRG